MDDTDLKIKDLLCLQQEYRVAKFTGDMISVPILAIAIPWIAQVLFRYCSIREFA
jgi:hypothetical protein